MLPVAGLSLAFAPRLTELQLNEKLRLEHELTSRARFELERGSAEATGLSGAPGPTKPVQLITDTDLGFDVDDVGAISVANHLQDIGACELLAVVHNTGFAKGIGGVSVVNNWYNRSSSVKLGAYKGVWASSAAAQSAQDRYTTTIETRYPSPVQDSSQVDDAVTAYKAALSAAADGSVVIASIGEPTNLRDLLKAEPALFARKVKQVHYMDGGYNFGCADANGGASSPYLGSTAGCAGAAQYVVEHVDAQAALPTRQLFSLNGGDVLSGGRFSSGCGLGPVKDAYQIWTGGNSRPSWDLISVYFAVMGTASLYSSERQGTMAVDAAGAETFDTANATSNQAQVWVDGEHNGDVVRRLDDVICSSPCRGDTPIGACAGYTMNSGRNCYGARGTATSHGATDLESPPSSSCGTMTLHECMKRCDTTDGCEGVTVTPQPGGLVACYRKGAIDIAKCDYGNAWGFDTWVKKPIAVGQVRATSAERA